MTAPTTRPTPSFDQVTGVERVGDEGSGVYSGYVFDGWDILGNVNGGYLMAIAARAIADRLGAPPVSVTGHFLKPGRAGALRVEVDVIRTGHRFSTATAGVWQDDQRILSVMATVGTVERGDVALADQAPPSMPAFDDPSVISTVEEIEASPTIFRSVDVRLANGSGGFRTGHPTGRAEIEGWFAWLDGGPVDEIGLLLVADVFPPPVFNTDLPMGWVPTLELTVHVRGVPAPGPLKCRFKTSFIQDGMLSEDGWIWDSQDRLVCQSRQLALTPRA